MRRTIAGMVLFTLCSVSVAAAQGPLAGRFFVDAMASADVEQRSHINSQSPVVTTTDLSATVPGGGIAVGTFFTPRASVRVEVAYSGKLDASFQSPFGLPTTFVTSTTYQNDSRNGLAAVLLGYHTDRRRRIQLGYVGGVAFVRERSHSKGTIVSSGIPPFIAASTEIDESTSIIYHLGVAVGFDLEVALGSHVSLVPQTRVVAFNGAVGIRPGIGIRWSP